MGKITRLADTLINQIAAGEMIERPASIIKELCENALDAGAHRLEVAFEEGGIKTIVIADDGEGISAEDLPLAVERHATSKIAVFTDLLGVSTLGFRGEALASIASAAVLEINSADGDSPELLSAKLCAEGGVVSAITPSHRARGTTVVVRDLFFNIPARRQFLKSVATEAGHCLEMCRRLALTRADVAWSVRHNQRLILDYPMVANSIERARAVLGEAFFGHYREFHETLAEGAIRGVLSLPSAQSLSASREAQYLFVNGRFIRDRVITRAIRDGYAEMKHDAKTLSFVVWIDWANDQVDVNVSPMKTEVRWRQSALIYQAVLQSVRKALSSSIGNHPPPQMPLFNAVKAANFPAHASLAARFSFDGHRGASVAYERASADLPIYDIGKEPPSDKPLAESTNESSTQPLDGADDEMPPLGFAIGQVHHQYILAQNRQGLVIVEIHAAHERLLFEQLRQYLGDSQIPAQTLLVPWHMDMDEAEAETFVRHRELWQRLGLIAEMVLLREGAHQLILSAVPALLAQADYAQIMRALLHDFAEYGQSEVLSEAREQVLATMACHGARRGAQTMSLAEMNALLREMEKWERAGSCNHGRPSYAIVPLSAFDRFFMRGQ